MTAGHERHWQAWLRSAVTERWPAKISALAMALLLWLVVTLQAPAENWVEVHLDLSVDSGFALADAPPRVRALIDGRGRDLIELAGSPPVAHMEAGNAGNDVAVIAFAASDVELPAGVEARVRDVRPRVIRLRLRRVP